MSESYSESSSYVAGLTLPLDSELATMTTVKPVFTRIADRTKFLLDRLLGSAAGDAVKCNFAALSNLNSRFLFVGAGTTLGWQQSNIGDQGQLTFHVALPKGVSKIQGQRALIDGDGGGVTHTNPPATLPQVRLYSKNVSTGVVTLINSTTDAPANLAAYEAPHLFGPTALNHTVDANNEYYLDFLGEAGTDSIANALLLMRAFVLVDP